MNRTPMKKLAPRKPSARRHVSDFVWRPWREPVAWDSKGQRICFFVHINAYIAPARAACTLRNLLAYIPMATFRATVPPARYQPCA